MRTEGLRAILVTAMTSTPISLPSILAVAAGGALGSVLRHVAAEAARRLPALGAFPWGTLGVNVLGSLGIGVVAGLVVGGGGALQSAPLRAFLMVGVLGGFTTFSTFALESLTLLQAGHALRAVVYGVASVVLAVAAAALGFTLSRA